MTNQEASKIIKDGLEDMSLDYIDIEQYEALNMAIKALEQEPSGQWVSEKVDGEDWKGCKRQYYQPISCSKCHSPNHYKSVYCPNCGARMVEPQERSDKE